MVEADQDQRQRKVAVVIPAWNEAKLIAGTIRACKAIPYVDLVVVVDDGSTDGTSDVARAAADAVVVRHSINRGKASAMETGAKIVAMRDLSVGPSRSLLFLDADLGESAASAAPLVLAVLARQTDCAIAFLPPQKGAGGRGLVVGAARNAIERITGWKPKQPLSGQRCLTRDALNSAQPLASGWGVETAMTIDMLLAGFTVQEIPCDLTHRATGRDLPSQMHRASQLRDVLTATITRRFHRRGLSRRAVAQASRNQAPFEPYSLG